MNDVAEQLRRAVADLSVVGARFALVGGLAVSVRAEPRLTRDLDFVVAVADDAEAEDLVTRLREFGYLPAQVVEQVAVGRLATVRLGTAAGGVTDLLFASSGIEPELVAAATPLEVIPGLRAPVATVGHLLAIKLLARDDRRRPTDADDLRALAEIAVDEDWAVARTAVELIVERGYARDRDLVSALAELRERGAY